MGLLYGGNTAGAVFGCLLAGFYLLRQFDMSTATFVAAVLNVLVGLGALWVAGRTPERARVLRRRSGVRLASPRLRLAGQAAWPIYVAIAISGACALGAEVVWTRLLGLMLGATVYTFSIILAVFLVGIGIGSGAASAMARWFRGAAARATGARRVPVAARRGDRLDGLHACRFAALLAGESAAFHQPVVSPSRSTWCARCGPFCRRPLLWGASFPLALAAAATRGEDPARLVGGIYAANTGGAIVGALASAWC